MDKKGAANEREESGRDKHEVSGGGDGRRAADRRISDKGQVPEVKVAGRLSAGIAGCAVIADKGYDSDEFRRELERNNNEPVIPGRRNRREARSYDCEKYKKRGQIERLFGKIKENRRLAVRYEKSDIHFRAFILIAFIKISLFPNCA